MKRPQTGKMEVDAVLENQKGEVVVVEIQGNSTPRLEDLKGLKIVLQLQVKSFFGGFFFIQAIKLSHAEKIFAVPICALWS